jgi:protein gp37
MSTTISWTHAPGFKGETWNPIKATNIETGKRGWFCTKPSAGCKNCYAEARNRHIGNGLKYTHANADKVRLELVNLDRPLTWRKPRMVFVCSMTDLFLELHTDEMILAIFATMVAANRHVYQLLTKRPQRMREFLERYVGNGTFTPEQLQHCWFGTTTENQATADERAPELFALRSLLPNAILWLSCEPLLGPVNLSGWIFDIWGPPLLNWVVPGGESGMQARECLLTWIEAIVADCDLAGVPCFVKQLGRHPANDLDGTETPLTLKDRKGEDWDEWPERLRVRQFPDMVRA